MVGSAMTEEGSNPDDDAMRYAVAGGERPKAAEALEKYTGTVGWTYLKPHFEAGVLYFVDPSLVIAEVGEAIANDDKQRVESWLASGDFLKPGELHAKHWQEVEQVFLSLVVSPFVLAQPIASDQADG